jgi:hypothetical protein
MYSNEVFFKLGVMDICVRRVTLNGGPAVRIYQDVNGGEYYILLAEMNCRPLMPLLDEKQFRWSAAGRLQLAWWAGSLATVVNANPDQSDEWARGLLEILDRAESESRHLHGVKDV